MAMLSKLVFNSDLFKTCVTVMFISPQTWQNAWIVILLFNSERYICKYIGKEKILIFLTLPKDQPSSILFMPHSSWMFSASLSRTFSK